jgi:hypothetical protein
VLVTIATSEKIEMVAVLGNTVMLVTSNCSAVRNNTVCRSASNCSSVRESIIEVLLTVATLQKIEMVAVLVILVMLVTSNYSEVIDN